MSSSGFPDWQRITQWFAAPIAQATGVSLDGGDVTVGPFDLLSFASVIVCVKAIGGPVVVTLTDSIPGGPASLQTTTSFTVAAGNVEFQGIVLDAGGASVTFHETGPGTTVDYAIVPSNVNTNVAGALLAQLDFFHNDAAVANETGLDFEDSASLAWAVVDDPANARVKVTPTVHAALGVTVLFPGSTSYTVPTGTTELDVEGNGSGGGGGGTPATAAGQAAAGGGGGGGGYCYGRLTANIGTHTVAIGSGGAANVGGAGGAGNTTSFKDTTAATVLNANGGGGGGLGSVTVAVTAGGAAGGGGNTVTGFVHVGAPGAVGVVLNASAPSGWAGSGGAAARGGGGGLGTTAFGSPGTAGGVRGGGGSGATAGAGNVARAGGAGADGVLMMTAWA